jgi:HK97 family phage portal protein
MVQALAPAEIMDALQTRPENPQRRQTGNGEALIEWIRTGGDGRVPDDVCGSGATPVSPETALGVATCWACIDAIAAPIASSDWNAYAGARGASNQTALPEDALQYILNTRPNPEMTAQSAKRAMMIAAAGWGNGYAEIVRDLAGRVIQLWPLSPDRCEQRRDTETGELFLRVQNDGAGSYVDLPMRDVFQIRGPGISGVLGDNQLHRAVKTLALAVALDQFSQAYFSNGTQMGVVLEVPGLGRMDDSSYDRMKESWNSRHRGPSNAFRLGFAEGGVKIHQLQVEAQKAQMTEARYQMVEEICRWWKVPPHKVGHLLRATNNNIEHQGLEFSRDTLRPWKVEIQQECDFKLIPPRVKKFVDIDLDWAAEGDFGSRAVAIQTLRACGVYSVNDALRKLGENTISAAEGGDARTMNGASVRLEDVGKNMLPATPSTPAEPAANDAVAAEEDSVDAVASAWIRSVFARAKARHDEFMAGKGGERKDAAQWARKSATEYLTERCADMDSVFRGDADLLASAVAFGLEVIDGLAPAEAAQRLMAARKGNLQ